MFSSSLLTAGVVSWSFQKLAARDVVRLARQARLHGIEWGGNQHVPPGDKKQARTAKEMTRDAGLAVTAYGSSFRLGESESKGLPFKLVLDTAMELAAPTIRVFAGARGSQPHEPPYRNQVIEESRRIASQAAAVGVSIAYEFCAGTLTDTNESATQLLRSVNHPNVRTFWQPPAGQPADYALAGLQSLLGFVTNVHVQLGAPVAAGGTDGQPLSAGEERWRPYIKALRATGRSHMLLLESLRGDAAEQFQQDAATLKEWLE